MVMTRALVSQLQSLAEDLQLTGVEGQTDGKLCSSREGGTGFACAYMYMCTCMCGSTHVCGCVVDNAMVAL